MTVGRVVLDGILHNDLFIVLQPEYRMGMEARMQAFLQSMTPLQPMPEYIANGNYYRTPMYVQEIAHRKATRKRVVKGI